MQAGPAAAEPDERTRRARKIHPRLARGEPERVAVVLNLAEGELVQGILLEEGIPSILRRSGGFDVPDMIAAGPRDVMVPASAVETARGLLAAEVSELDEEGQEVEDDREEFRAGDERERPRAALRMLAVLLVALLLFSVAVGGGLALFY